MSDRDRLVALLKEADDATEVYNRDYPTYEKAMQAFYTSIADHLLANGVIVLPCAVRSRIYFILENGEIDSQLIDNVQTALFFKDINGNLIRGFYLTKEEAEARLRELERE